jgi:hypothetical protein
MAQGLPFSGEFLNLIVGVGGSLCTWAQPIIRPVRTGTEKAHISFPAWDSNALS